MCINMSMHVNARTLAHSTSYFLPIGHWSWKLSPRCFSSLAPFGLTPCCQMVTRVRRHLFLCAIPWHFGTWFNQFRWILPMDMILSHVSPLAHGIGWFDIINDLPVMWIQQSVESIAHSYHSESSACYFWNSKYARDCMKLWWVMKPPISRDHKEIAAQRKPHSLRIVVILSLGI